MRIVRLTWIALALASAQLATAQSQRDRNDRDTYEGAYDPTKPTRFNQQPNSLLMHCIQGRAAGRALDVGMGNGRNSIALAQAGWQVTGFDIAAIGVEQANEKAAQLHLKLKAYVQSSQDFDFGANQWDLVVLTYQPFRDILDRLRRASKWEV